MSSRVVRRRAVRGVVLLLAASAAACASVPKSIEATDATVWTATAAEYDAIALQTWRAAAAALDPVLADSSRTAALEQTGSFLDLPPAVIVDVDETVLDNAPYQASLVARETAYPDGWAAWIHRAAAPPVPGALAFARAATRRGVTIFYVTNRNAELEEATARNLDRAGFPLREDVDVVLTRGEREVWRSDKSTRRAHVAERYRIVLLAGDDLNDFATADEASVSERDSIVEAHRDRWGRTWFALPNPMYGSWERAIGDLEAKRERAKAVSTP